jgi:hypothetical protein
MVAHRFQDEDDRRRQELDAQLARDGKRSPRGGRSRKVDDDLCSVCRANRIRKDNNTGVCYRCHQAPARGRSVAKGEAPPVQLEVLTERQLRGLMDAASAELRKRREG